MLAECGMRYCEFGNGDGSGSGRRLADGNDIDHNTDGPSVDYDYQRCLCKSCSHVMKQMPGNMEGMCDAGKLPEKKCDHDQVMTEECYPAPFSGELQCDRKCKSCERALRECEWCLPCLNCADEDDPSPECAMCSMTCGHCEAYGHALIDGICQMPSRPKPKPCDKGFEWVWHSFDHGECFATSCEAKPCARRREEEQKFVRHPEDVFAVECRDIPETELYCPPAMPCERFWCEWTPPVKCGDGEVYDELMDVCLSLTCESAEACPEKYTCIDTIASNNTYCGGRAICPQYTCAENFVDCEAEEGAGPGFEFDTFRNKCSPVSCAADPCKDGDRCEDRDIPCAVAGTCRKFKCMPDVVDTEVTSEQISDECTYNATEACVEAIKEKEQGEAATLDDKIRIEEKFLDAAIGAATKTMQSCLDGADATCETCMGDAKNAFLGSGAKPGMWHSFKDMVCYDALPASDMDLCIEREINTFMNRTADAFLGDEAWDKIARSCEASSLNAFTGAGGDPEAWVEAQEEDATGAAMDSFDRCMSEFPFPTDEEPDDEAIQAAHVSCEPDAMNEFMLMGGDQGLWATTMVDAARGAASGAFEFCMEAVDDKALCKAEVADVFANAGGAAEDLEYELAKGARDAGYEGFIGCFEDGTAANECLNTAYNKYVGAGGEPSARVWKVELQLSATENAGDLIQRCQKAGKNRTECRDKAEKLYTDVAGASSGGAVDEVFAFDLVEQQAKTDAIKDVLKPCVNHAVLNAKANGKSEPDAVREAHRACKKKAQERFVNAGGDIEDYEIQEQYAAKDAMADKLKACAKQSGSDAAQCQKECKKDFASVAGSDDTVVVALEEAQAKVAAETRMECDGDSTTCTAAVAAVLESMGATKTEVERKIQEGSRDITATKMEACIAAAENASPMDPEAIFKCTDKAKKVYEKAGGKDGDFETEQRRGAGGRCGDVFGQCLKSNQTTHSDCAKAAEKKYADLLGEDKALVAQFDMVRELVGKAVVYYADCKQVDEVDDCWTTTVDFFIDTLHGPAEDLDQEDVLALALLAGVPTTLVDIANAVDVKALLKGVTKAEVVDAIADFKQEIKSVLGDAVNVNLDAGDIAEHDDGSVGLSFVFTDCPNQQDALDFARTEMGDILDKVVVARRRRRLRSLAGDETIVDSTRAAGSTEQQAVTAPPTTVVTDPPSSDSPGGGAATDPPSAEDNTPTFEWEIFCAENPEDESCQDNAAGKHGAQVMLPLAMAALALFAQN